MHKIGKMRKDTILLSVRSLYGGEFLFFYKTKLIVCNSVLLGHFLDILSHKCSTQSLKEESRDFPIKFPDSLQSMSLDLPLTPSLYSIDIEMKLTDSFLKEVSSIQSLPLSSIDITPSREIKVFEKNSFPCESSGRLLLSMTVDVKSETNANLIIKNRTRLPSSAVEWCRVRCVDQVPVSGQKWMRFDQKHDEEKKHEYISSICRHNMDWSTESKSDNESVLMSMYNGPDWTEFLPKATLYESVQSGYSSGHLTVFLEKVEESIIYAGRVPTLEQRDSEMLPPSMTALETAKRVVFLGRFPEYASTESRVWTQWKHPVEFFRREEEKKEIALQKKKIEMRMEKRGNRSFTVRKEEGELLNAKTMDPWKYYPYVLKDSKELKLVGRPESHGTATRSAVLIRDENHGFCMMMPDYWYEFKKDVKPAAGVSRDVDELEKIMKDRYLAAEHLYESMRPAMENSMKKKPAKKEEPKDVGEFGEAEQQAEYGKVDENDVDFSVQYSDNEGDVEVPNKLSDDWDDEHVWSGVDGEESDSEGSAESGNENENAKMLASKAKDIQEELKRSRTEDSVDSGYDRELAEDEKYLEDLIFRSRDVVPPAASEEKKTERAPKRAYSKTFSSTDMNEENLSPVRPAAKKRRVAVGVGVSSEVAAEAGKILFDETRPLVDRVRAFLVLEGGEARVSAIMKQFVRHSEDKEGATKVTRALRTVAEVFHKTGKKGNKVKFCRLIQKK